MPDPVSRPRFPGPAELKPQKVEASTDEIDQLRALVHLAFETQDSTSGSSYSVQANGFSELAVQTVKQELQDAGWRVRHGDQRDLPGEFFIDPA